MKNVKIFNLGILDPIQLVGEEKSKYLYPYLDRLYDDLSSKSKFTQKGIEKFVFKSVFIN